MKLLRPFTGTAAIFWPIGRPPVGTCEFASEQCLNYCYAALPEFPDFDEELRIPETEKSWIMEKFLYSSLPELIDTIVQEAGGLQTNILHWFGSGDCPTQHIERVLSIIKKVDDEDIVQMGFTRNITLWEARRDIFALSVENVDDIAGRGGLFAVTDHSRGTSVMYRDNEKTQGGDCGPELCLDSTDDQAAHFINCKTCLRLGTGCFYGGESQDDKS